MSVTVADCLKLPALREAKLLAGASGLCRPVSTMSVLEYPDIAIMTRDILAGNELILTAFAFIKDNVDAQCRIIRHLHSMGEAGLILYYMGILIEKPDPRIVEVADDLGFPLISMPFGRLDFRYSDVIAEVMELVITDRKKDRYFVSDIVTRLSQLPPQNRTMTSALRLLSDRLHCALLLTDRYFTRKASAAWPVSNQLDYLQIVDALKATQLKEKLPVELFLEKKLWIWDMPVTSKKRQIFHLLILDEQNNQDYESLQQASEVVELFLNVWNQEVDYEETDALVSAILNESIEERDRIAARMHINLTQINTIWILSPKQRSAISVGNEQHSLRMLKQFLQEHHKLIVVDQVEEDLIALLDKCVFEESEAVLAADLVSRLKANNILVDGVVCQGLHNPAQIRTVYLHSKENLHTARLIYQNKSVFTYSEIRFAAQCREILSQGENAVKERMQCLEKIQDLVDKDELLQTLSVFLLDADQSSQKTGALLYLHRNTIKYRLSKIRTALDHELTRMPELLELYFAVALRRLLNPDKKT